MDFFFSCFSTYTYLSVTRIEQLAAVAGVKVRWRPFDVRAIMLEQNNRPFIGKPVKMKYMWRDLERRATQHGIAFNGVPPYPIDPDGISHRVATVAAIQGWCPEYARQLYRRWFLEHKPPNTPDDMRDLLSRLGKDPEAVLARAASPVVADRLMGETDEARRLGIFGSPTFAVGDEIFWGDDRLEIALDWCRQSRSSIGASRVA